MLNSVQLQANLTRDSQLSYLPSQTAVCEIGLANNRKFNKSDGTKGEEVMFIDAVCYGKTAEAINKYFKKGDQIIITARLKYESWSDNQGNKRNKLKLIVESFNFPGGNKKQSPQQNVQPETQAPPFDNQSQEEQDFNNINGH